jgi:hypothetical protein
LYSIYAHVLQSIAVSFVLDLKGNGSREIAFEAEVILRNKRKPELAEIARTPCITAPQWTFSLIPSSQTVSFYSKLKNLGL